MPILPLQGLPPLPIPTDPQQLVNQIINQYGPALISFAVTVAIFLVTFFVVYAIARIALVRLTKGALRSRGFGQEVRGLAGSVMAAIALFVALGGRRDGRGVWRRARSLCDPARGPFARGRLRDAGSAL